MKRLIALILAGLMALGGVSLAASWPEGRSAAQPYSRLPEVNLSETMGYIMLFPCAKLPVSRFCDILAVYLPREDIALGEGTARLYEKVEGEDKPVEVCSVDFTNTDSVVVRPMEEGELQDLMWGGGTCVEMFLPKSLELGEKAHDYFVLMDDGCFTANDGKLKSLQITSEEAWIPVIHGDYGVSGLYYIDAPLPTDGDEEEEDEIPEDIGIVDVDAKDAKAKKDEKAEEEASKQDAAEAEEGAQEAVDPSQYVIHPDPGDRVHFDLLLGGDAKLAVLYSDNGSVEFDEIEHTESGHVEGTVVGDDVQWGIAFYDANDYIFDTINIGR